MVLDNQTFVKSKLLANSFNLLFVFFLFSISLMFSGCKQGIMDDGTLITDDTDLSTSSSLSTTSTTTLEACPSGYVEVPSNPGFGVSRFCVMQYKAKAWNDANSNNVIDAGESDADGCGEAACTTAGWGSASHVPGSTETGLPWRMIDQVDAKAECQSLNSKFGVTDKYDLISNPEWMVIARNAENVAANWSSGTVGTGCMFRGNNGLNDACRPLQ